MALSNRTFGVEFEMCFDYNKFMAWITPNASNLGINLNKFRVPGGTDIERLITFIIKKNLVPGISGYVPHEDGSINTNNNEDFAVEIVTPILQGQEGINSIIAFCNWANEAGGYVNRSCGTHVHVGASDFKDKNKAAERLTLALLHFKSLEKVFDSLVERHRQGDGTFYARSPADELSIIERYRAVLQSDKKKIDDIVQYIGPGRYSKLNIASLLRHGTLEFRQLQGTLNPALISNWVKIVTSFVDMIITTENHFMQMFTELKEVHGKKPLVLSDKQIAAATKYILSNESKHNLNVLLTNALEETSHQTNIDYYEIERAFPYSFVPKIISPKVSKTKVAFIFSCSPALAKKEQASIKTKIENNLPIITKEFKNQLKQLGCTVCKPLNNTIDFAIALDLNKVFLYKFENTIKSAPKPILNKDVDNIKKQIGAVNSTNHIPKDSIKNIQNLKEEIALIKNLT